MGEAGADARCKLSKMLTDLTDYSSMKSCDADAVLIAHLQNSLVKLMQPKYYTGVYSNTSILPEAVRYPFS